MMIFYRLVRLIENHSQALAASLLDRVQNSEATRGYKNVPPDELKEHVFEIYRHLGDWLISKDERDLEARYVEIGARRALQHVPAQSTRLGDYFDQREPFSVHQKGSYA